MNDRIKSLAKDLTALHEGVEEVSDPYELALLLAGVRDLKRLLAAVYDDSEKRLLSVMDDKKLEVPGLGPVQARRKTNRKDWDNEGLTRTLVARALDERRYDEETGEYEPAWEAVARVLSECARPSWRISPLRERGLAIDEFCTEEPDGYSVQLPPAEKSW